MRVYKETSRFTFSKELRRPTSENAVVGRLFVEVLNGVNLVDNHFVASSAYLPRPKDTQPLGQRRYLVPKNTGKGVDNSSRGGNTKRTDLVSEIPDCDTDTGLDGSAGLYHGLIVRCLLPKFLRISRKRHPDIQLSDGDLDRKS